MITTLQTTWFILVFVLFAGYAVLDGFDLGVGVLHLLVGKTDRERRLSLNSIGPVWDGNEVWLVTGGGALFAAFPPVYAAVFSGFYIALMLLLAALIGRAVAMEFRSKVDSLSWKRAWDIVFSISSMLVPVLFGVAFGNILRGIPLNADGDFTGGFFSLLNPYSLVIGVLALVLFTMHGAIWLAGKTDEPMQTRAAAFVVPLWIIVVLLYALASALSMWLLPFQFENLLHRPIAWLLFVVLIAGLVLVPRSVLKTRRFDHAFIASSVSILCMMGLAGTSLFPRLVPASNDLALSLTAFDHSSTQRTLLTMLIIALVGMPLVIVYTAIIYRAFRGKVVLGTESY